jgi:hypothetical protein
MISPIATRYGVAYCTTCDLTLAYCRCAATQAALAARVLPIACGYCKQPLAACRCGTTPAQDGA